MQQEGYSGSLRRPVLLAFILLFLTVLPTVAQTNSLTFNESFGVSFAKILSGPGNCRMSACNHSLPDLPDLVLSLRK